jgi:hypothetical protein
MSKIRPESHEIAELAVTFLKNKVVKELSWIFREMPQAQDYGHDGEIEEVDAREVSGKIHKIQIKGTKNLKIKNGHVSFSISRNELEYLAIKSSISTVLIVVNVVNQECYWFNLHSCVNILTVNKNQKSFTLKTSIENAISHGNKFSFKEALNEERFAKTKQGMIEQLSEKSLSEAVSQIESISPSILDIPGFKLEKRVQYSFVPEEKLDQNDMPQITGKLKLKFPNTEEGFQKKKEWIGIVSGQNNRIKLGEEFIEHIDGKIGSRDIFGSHKAKSLEIYPVKNQFNLYLKCIGMLDEICLKAHFWFEDKIRMIVDSSEYDNLQFLGIKSDDFFNKNGKVEIYPTRKKTESCTEEISILNFLKSLEFPIQLYIEANGVKKLHSEAIFSNPKNIPNGSFKLFEYLSQIERIFNVKFEPKKLVNVSLEETQNILLLYQAITDTKVLESIDFVLDNPAEFNKEKVFRFSIPVNFKILDQIIIVPHQYIFIQGSCRNIKPTQKTNNGYGYKYKLDSDETSISIVDDSLQKIE